MAASTIDEYIAGFPEEKQAVLKRIRQCIREAAPEAVEKISYQMPGFWLDEMLIWFSGMKGHIGIYPTNRGVAAFADRLAEYSVAKGTIRLPWDNPIPYGLIADITRFRLAEAKAKRK